MTIALKPYPSDGLTVDESPAWPDPDCKTPSGARVMIVIRGGVRVSMVRVGVV